MAVAEKVNGSQTCTVNTEHTLATITDAGVYYLAVDFNASTGGSTPDVFEVRYYGKARSSDTERLMELFSLQGAQPSPLVAFKPVISPHYLKITLKQTAGTGRSAPWSVYQT